MNDKLTVKRRTRFGKQIISEGSVFLRPDGRLFIAVDIFSDGGIAGDIVEQDAPHFPVGSEELPSAVALLETYTRMPDWMAWELGGEGPH